MNALIDVISKTFNANQDELNTALAYLNRIADEDYTTCIQYLVEIICSREACLLFDFGSNCYSCFILSGLSECLLL